MFNLLMTGALVGLIYLFNRHSLGLFLPDDGTAIGIAQHINAIVLWSFILFGFTIVLFGTVRAHWRGDGTAGDSLPVDVGGALAVCLGTERTIGADAIWWSFPLGSIVSVTLAVATGARAISCRRHPARRRSRSSAPQAPDTSMGTPCEEALSTVGAASTGEAAMAGEPREVSKQGAD
ncbi:hypothetical protein ACU4GD_26750 [Cupriavidus basilensis]